MSDRVVKDEAAEYARVHDLLHRVRDLSERDRDDLLDRECGADGNLRSRILALLAAGTDDTSDDILSELAVGRVRDRLEALVEPEPREWLPERIGPYRVLGKLGHGGMGVVYEAEQVAPRRRVAIKLLHPMHATIDRLRRLRQEAEVLGRLQHPGIAQVYEANTDDFGYGPQPYFAMELIDGVDLREHCQRTQPSIDERVGLLAAIADAVHSAHEKGVVHRDLKPENVLVDREGRPRVVDFGIALATDQGSSISTCGTEAGQLIGTLAYMAPEQVSGDLGEADRTIDVFALGVLGFEIITGRLPREVDGLSISQAVSRLISTEPARARSIDPTLRGDLETVLAKALETEPERRYATATDFAADLRRVLAHRPIEARPPTRMYLARKFTRRNRALVGGVVATLLASILGTVIAVFFAAEADDQRREARESERRAIHSVYQSAATLVEADKPREADLQLMAVPESFRGVSWTLMRRSLPQILDLDPVQWMFIDDDRIISHVPVGGRWIEVSLPDRRVIAEWPVLPEIAALVATSERGIAIGRTGDQRMFRLDLVRGTTTPLPTADPPLGLLRWPEISADGRTILCSPTETSVRVDIDGKLALEITDLPTDTRAHLARDGRSMTVVRTDRLEWIALPTGRVIATTPIAAGGTVSGFPVTDGLVLLDGPEKTHDPTPKTWVRIPFPEEARFEDATPFEIEDPFSRGLRVPRRFWDFYDISLSTDGRTLALSREGSGGGAIFDLTEGARDNAPFDDARAAEDPRWVPFLDSDASFVRLAPGATRALVTSNYARPVVVEVADRGARIENRPAPRALVGHLDPEREQATENPEPLWVYHLAVSHDGMRIASATPLDPTVIVWDRITGEVLATLERTAVDPESWDALIAFSPDGERLVFTSSYEGRGVRVVEWNLLDGSVTTYGRLPDGDSRHVALLSRFLEVLGPAARARLGQRAQMFDGIAVTGRYHLKPHAVKLATIPPDPGWRYLAPETETMTGLAIHPTSPIAALVDQPEQAVYEGRLRIFDLETGTVTFERTLDGMPWCCAFHPDGSVLTVGTGEGRIQQFETEGFTREVSWKLHDDYIYSLAWTAEGSALITASGDGSVKVSDLRTPSARHEEGRRYSELLRNLSERDDLESTWQECEGLERVAARALLIRRAAGR